MYSILRLLFLTKEKLALCANNAQREGESKTRMLSLIWYSFPFLYWELLWIIVSHCDSKYGCFIHATNMGRGSQSVDRATITSSANSVSWLLDSGSKSYFFQQLHGQFLDLQFTICEALSMSEYVQGKGMNLIRNVLSVGVRKWCAWYYLCSYLLSHL